MEYVSALFGSLLTLMIGLGENPQTVATPNFDCEEIVWSEPPKVENSLFTGAVEILCRIQPTRDSFSDLQKFMIEYVQKSAKIIHSGPTAEFYVGLPSVGHDVTLEVSNADTQIRLRGASHVAHDNSRLVYALLSKSIEGTGNAAYLKKVDVGYTVTWNPMNENFDVLLTNSTHVKKPSLAPTGYFREKVRKEVEAQVSQYKNTILNEISNHLSTPSTVSWYKELSANGRGRDTKEALAEVRVNLDAQINEVARLCVGDIRVSYGLQRCDPQAPVGQAFCFGLAHVHCN